MGGSFEITEIPLHSTAIFTDVLFDLLKADTLTALLFFFIVPLFKSLGLRYG